MSDRGPNQQFPLRSFDIDVNPLIVAGCLRELTDTLLGHRDPVAHSDLGTDRGFDFVEISEEPHVALHPKRANGDARSPGSRASATRSKARTGPCAIERVSPAPLVDEEYHSVRGPAHMQPAQCLSPVSATGAGRIDVSRGLLLPIPAGSAG